MAAAREERDQLELLKKLKQDQLDIKAAERKLRVRKQALVDAQKGAEPHHHDDDDDDDKDSSVSMPEQHLVCRTSTQFLLIIMSNLSGVSQGHAEASTG